MAEITRDLNSWGKSYWICVEIKKNYILFILYI